MNIRGFLALFVASTGFAAGDSTITLPGYPSGGEFNQVVLFSFDDWAFPFHNHVETRLFEGENPRLVIRPGAPGSYDEDILYYGTVIRVGDTYRLWYNGNFGPHRVLTGVEREKCCLCYAISKDGVHWEKPNLGLVDFNGSRNNNLTDFPDADLWSTCALVYDPADARADRRFKMAYEAGPVGHLRFRVAFSPDGLHWKASPLNPVGPFFEMAGVTKFQGLYYLNGQTEMTSWHRRIARRLATFVSADFEHWSSCAAVGLDRAPDVEGPSTDDQRHQLEEVHLGAALWNRGNVLLGVYGQWHGHPSGDRRMLTMDLGLAITHDAIHFHEPIPNFRFVPAREQPESPLGVGPALMQGQGMENIGDSTCYWYCLWRGNIGSGVRMTSWPRDRLGALEAFSPEAPEVISCAVRSGGNARVFVNASGLGPNTRLRIDLVDQAFRPIPGFSGAAAAQVATNGFEVPVSWQGGSSLPSGRTVRLDVHYDGMRPESARLYAVYIRN